GEHADLIGRGQTGIDDVEIWMDRGAEEQRGAHWGADVAAGCKLQCTVALDLEGSESVALGGGASGNGEYIGEKESAVARYQILRRRRVHGEHDGGVWYRGQRTVLAYGENGVVRSHGAGMAESRIAAIGDEQPIPGDSETVRLHAGGVKNADPFEAAVWSDAERSYRMTALVDGEEQAAVRRRHYLLTCVVRANDLGQIDLSRPAGSEIADFSKVACGVQSERG